MTPADIHTSIESPQAPQKRKRSSSVDDSGSEAPSNRPSKNVRHESLSRALSDHANETTAPTHTVNHAMVREQPQQAPPVDVSASTIFNAATQTAPQQTPAATKPLHEMPERAERYLTTYSTFEGVEWKNPDKFCLKPAFWQRWQPHDYVNLAEHIRYQFDPRPFARASGKPFEEINLIVNRLIANPLYESGEAMKRGQKGIDEIMANMKKWATPTRPWGKDAVKGELDSVASSSTVRLILENGSLKYLGSHELTPVDTKYLDQTLSEGDWMLFYGKTEAAYENMKGGEVGKNEGNVPSKGDEILARYEALKNSTRNVIEDRVEGEEGEEELLMWASRA